MVVLNEFVKIKRTQLLDCNRILEVLNRILPLPKNLIIKKTNSVGYARKYLFIY